MARFGSFHYSQSCYKGPEPGAPVLPCSDYATLTLQVGGGNTVTFTVECQRKRGHTDDHCSDMLDAVDSTGRDPNLRVLWANYDQPLSLVLEVDGNQGSTAR